MSDAEVTKNVFSMSIDHGVRPTDGSYAYSVILDVYGGCAANSIAELLKSRWDEVIRNDAEVQSFSSIWGYSMFVFHESGECYVLPSGESEDSTPHKIEVDRPCLVIMEWDDDQIDLAVSDPTQKEESVRITIDGDEHEIDLPQGGMAGASVGISIPR